MQAIHLLHPFLAPAFSGGSRLISLPKRSPLILAATQLDATLNDRIPSLNFRRYAVFNPPTPADRS
jgi:hypothetical protein